jgi:hypothetical protein
VILENLGSVYEVSDYEDACVQQGSGLSRQSNLILCDMFFVHSSCSVIINS